MALVVLPKGVLDVTGGAREIRIEADSIRELLRALGERFPGLPEKLRAGMAVSIDGEIVAEPLLERLEPESEVHFVFRVGGGK